MIKHKIKWKSSIYRAHKARLFFKTETKTNWHLLEEILFQQVHLIFSFLQVMLILVQISSITIHSSCGTITRKSIANLTFKSVVSQILKDKINLNLDQLLWWLKSITRTRLISHSLIDQSSKRRETLLLISYLVRSLVRSLTRKCLVTITHLSKYLPIRSYRVGWFHKLSNFLQAVVSIQMQWEVKVVVVVKL